MLVGPADIADSLVSQAQQQLLGERTTQCDVFFVHLKAGSEGTSFTLSPEACFFRRVSGPRAWHHPCSKSLKPSTRLSLGYLRCRNAQSRFRLALLTHHPPPHQHSGSHSLQGPLQVAQHGSCRILRAHCIVRLSWTVLRSPGLAASPLPEANGRS